MPVVLSESDLSQKFLLPKRKQLLWWGKCYEVIKYRFIVCQSQVCQVNNILSYTWVKLAQCNNKNSINTMQYKYQQQNKLKT